ncbi:MAG: alpha/beta fold hydrolase [Planctomycetes bacterium]|nr:alpha/beta fold hydrolase [Planctomycetota bacterium]
MKVDLVQATTPDGLRLDGALHVAEPCASDAPINAVLCLHGAGSNFYSSLLTDIAPHFVEAGIALLRVNTRGHDGISTSATATGAYRGGAAYEDVDECRYDVRGWIDFLRQQGYERIALLGHSLGAIKAVYSQAFDPHEAIRCVLAVSPARLSHSYFRETPRGSRFFDTHATAKEHVEAGRGGTLMQVIVPIPLVITAAGYVDKYGPEERFNILKFADRVTCPTFYTFGELELQTGIAFVGLPEAIADLPEGKSSREIITLGGADHMYTGVRDVLAERLIAWLRGQRDSDALT